MIKDMALNGFSCLNWVGKIVLISWLYGRGQAHVVVPIGPYIAIRAFIAATQPMWLCLLDHILL